MGITEHRISIDRLNLQEDDIIKKKKEPKSVSAQKKAGVLFHEAGWQEEGPTSVSQIHKEREKSTEAAHLFDIPSVNF